MNVINGWSEEALIEQIERKIRMRRQWVETAKITKDIEYRKHIEKMIQSHLIEEEYRKYIREIIIATPPPVYHPPRGPFTMKEKTQIKKDWCKLFPEMDYSRRENMIGKIVGPLLIAVDFEMRGRWGAEYRVSSFIFPLVYSKDYMAVNLRTRSSPEVITYYEHPEDYPKSAKFLKENFSLLEGDINLENILKEYKKRKTFTHGEAGVPAVLSAWAGEPKKAKEYLEWGANYIAEVYKDNNDPNDINHYYDILGRKLSLELPFKDIWRQYHQDMIDNPQMLRELARKEAVRWGLQYAPYQDIAGAPYQEGNIFKDALTKPSKKK